MIYVDTSVVLAFVYAEVRRPTSAFWQRPDLVASRLTEIESWVRTNAYGRMATHGQPLAEVLACLNLLAVTEAVCLRARAPFSVPVRTLDAIHLASADFLRTQGFDVALATYDHRMGDAARSIGFKVMEP